MTDIDSGMPDDKDTKRAELIDSLLESFRGIQGYMKGNMGREEETKRRKKK